MDDQVALLAVAIALGAELRYSLHRYTRRLKALEERLSRVETRRIRGTPPAIEEPTPRWNIKLPGMDLVALSMSLLCLGGCIDGSSHRAERADQTQRVHLVGGVGNMAVDLVVDADTSTTTNADETHETHVDGAALGKALAAAANAASGGTWEMIAKAIGAAGAIGTTVASVVAVKKHHRAKRAERKLATATERFTNAHPT